MKIFFLTELYPAPNQGGEYLRTNGLVKILMNTGFDFFAIFGSRGNLVPEINLPKEKFTVFNFRPHYSKSNLVSSIKKFKKLNGLIEIIDQVILEFKPDLVFIDYNYYGQYISYFRKKGLPVIYGTHNIQSELTMQSPATSIRNKIARYLTFKIYRFHEKFYLKKANAILTVSEKDSEYYYSFINREKVFCIPNFIDADDYHIPDTEKQNYIVMPGNFGAYQNIMGLEWFLKNVWDAELENITKFIIIGRFSDKIFNKLNQDKNYRNVTAYGEVDDIKPYISKAKITIAPLLHGSGTRLKCIESMALKTQIVSTSVGAEGIDHEGSIVIADSPPEFKKAIIKILNENIDYTEKAYEIFENKYSLKKTIKVFREIVLQIIPN